MSKRIEEHPSLKNLRWRPVGLTREETEAHDVQLEQQRLQDEADQIASEALAKKTELKQKKTKPSRGL